MQIDIRKARVRPWGLVFVLLVLMLSIEFVVKPALAAPGETGQGMAAITVTPSVSSLLDTLGLFIQASMETANAKAQLLIGDGQSLLIAIAGLMLAWNAVLWILGGDLEGIIKSFITFVLLWGLAKYALDNYASLTNTIAAGFDYIAAKLGMDPRHFLQSLFKGSASPLEEVNKVFSNLSLMEWASNLINIVTIGLLAGLVSIAILAAGVIVTAVIAVSQVLFAIAVVLGPILIPFMLLPPLSGLATGWLNYLVYAGFVKVVGVVMIVFLSSMSELLLKQTYVTDGAIAWGGYIAATIIVGLMAFLSMRTMEIASGIVGGSPLRGVLSAGASAAAGMGRKLTGAKK